MTMVLITYLQKRHLLETLSIASGKKIEIFNSFSLVERLFTTADNQPNTTRTEASTSKLKKKKGVGSLTSHALSLSRVGSKGSSFSSSPYLHHLSLPPYSLSNTCISSSFLFPAGGGEVRGEQQTLCSLTVSKEGLCKSLFIYRGKRSITPRTKPHENK